MCLNLSQFKLKVKPLKINQDQSNQRKSKYLTNKYKNYEDNSNESDEFNTVANETSDEEDEAHHLKNKNGSKHQDESDQLKVLNSLNKKNF
jgi:hypothetical protein